MGFDKFELVASLATPNFEDRCFDPNLSRKRLANSPSGAVQEIPQCHPQDRWFGGGQRLLFMKVHGNNVVRFKMGDEGEFAAGRPRLTDGLVSGVVL